MIFIFETASVNPLSSSAVNRKSADERFSWRWANFVVPGMGTIQGFWARSHASASVHDVPETGAAIGR